MSLQSLCDDVEERFGITVQIKSVEESGLFGTKLIEKYLVVTMPGLESKFTSAKTMNENSLSWWLTGLVQGAGMARMAIFGEGTDNECSRPTG
jgi:hypothetical protein